MGRGLVPVWLTCHSGTLSVMACLLLKLRGLHQQRRGHLSSTSPPDGRPWPSSCPPPQPQPALYSFATPLQHSGFEGFTVDFQWDVYPQHMKAYGYNAFWLYGAANSWVRNVREGQRGPHCSCACWHREALQLAAPRKGARSLGAVLPMHRVTIQSSRPLH